MTVRCLKMFKLLICLFAHYLYVSAAGEFRVLHHPDSILFKGHGHIKESLLKEVYSASLGFSTEQDSNWQGLYLLDPFNLAKAVVTVAVDGVSDLDLEKGHHFPLQTDVDEREIFDALQKRVKSRHPEDTSQLVRVDLSDGLESVENEPVFSGIRNVNVKKYDYFDGSLEEDRKFLQELALINAITQQIEAGVIKSDSVPDIFWLKVSSLHPLSDLHGENSTVTKEAKRLLREVIYRINDAFDKAYKSRVIVTVITSDASHTRRIRAADNVNVKAGDDFSGLNLAKIYSADYPVIFNILLWLCVVMVFSLIAISYFIADMDPGRDSIIYRMTSTRMKKDN